MPVQTNLQGVKMNKIEASDSYDLFISPKCHCVKDKNEFSGISILHFSALVRIMIPRIWELTGKDDFYGHLFLQKQGRTSDGIQADDRPLRGFEA